MNTRTTWQAKMNNPNLPKVVPIPPKMRKRFGTGAMLIPSPREVDALIRTVPKGSVVTVSKMREILAGKQQADVTCPLTTGIFVRIAAEAAEEQSRAGKVRITPYWRAVKDDGSLNPKVPRRRGAPSREAARGRPSHSARKRQAAAPGRN